MCSLTDVCFMCTSASICTIIDDKIVSQVEYLLPEITVVKLGIPLHICSICVKDLQSFNKFKQVCVENCQRLEARIKESQSNRDTDKLINDSPNTQLRTNSETKHSESGENVQTFEEIFIKEEILEENSDDRDFYNSLVPNISMKECVTDNTNCGYVNTSATSYVDVDIPKNESDNNLNCSNDYETSTDSEKQLMKPENNSDAAKVITLNLLPEKSRAKYEKQYELFIEWCKNENIGRYSESVVLAYFSEKSKTVKCSTLWSMYSMLRAVLSVKNDIDISQYKILMTFLKTQSIGYKAKKSRIFTKEQVLKFLIEAPDKTYLLKKVILIMGIFGACSRDELVKMTIKEVDDKDSILIVKIPDSKTKQSRVFTVNNNDQGTVDFLSIYRRYVALRPKDADTPSRLFLRYAKGKCYKQVVGMNIIGRTPREIAEYLNLPDFKLYNGHSFRRTSATLVANRGGDIM